MYTTAYAVTIDGESYEIFADKEEVTSAIDDVQREVGDVLNREYEINNDVTIEEVFTLKSHVNGTSEELEEYLYDNCDEITDSYILRVDGETIGIGEQEDLESVIDDVSEQYVNENTVSVRVLSDIEIDYETVPSELEEDTDAMTESLTEINEGEITYEVSETQTLNEVMEDIYVSTEQVLTLNPELTEEFIEEPEDSDEDIIEEDSENNIEDDIEDESSADIDDSPTLTEIAEESAEDIVLEEGAVLTIEPEKPLLVIETQDIETHNKKIPYETIEEDDDELYIGESEIRTEGEIGKAEVTETVTKLNGIQTERTMSDYTVIEEPIDEVIAIGTKEPEPEIIPEEIVSEELEIELTDDITISKDAGTETQDNTQNNTQNNTQADASGSVIKVETNQSTYYANNYVWPLNTGSISSGYGWRNLSGRSGEFHSGIDIAAPGGTPIHASNGGVICANGYNSARGWYVQIDHGDGYKTLYQHMCAQSSLSVGTVVYQGQTIGYVGTTGDSTGNHLHFEVWENGSTIDPITFFSNSSGTVNTDDSVSDLQNEIVSYAEQFIGCPYVHAGHGPDVFDCSGFTGYVYRHFGYEIYDSVECQLQYGTDVPIDVSQMKPGDLIFFDTMHAGYATHVGMYIGDGQYIHASSTYGQVMIDTVRSTENRPIVAVKRIID